MTDPLKPLVELKEWLEDRWEYCDLTTSQRDYGFDLIANAESSLRASIEAAQVEMCERIKQAVPNAQKIIYPGQEPMTTITGIMQAIDALPLSTNALELDRLRVRREEAQWWHELLKFGDPNREMQQCCERLAELDRQPAAVTAQTRTGSDHG